MRSLGKTGIVINEIGLGGIPIQRITREDVRKILETMIQEKMNFIDTARGYTNSEELLGYGLKSIRNQFIVATKSMSRTYEGMLKDVEISLKKLQTEYIDIYQIHNVAINENIEGVIEALKEEQQKGRVKHIGLTTHSIDVLKREVEFNRFETIQFPYNVVETQAESLFKEAAKKGIGIIVMKPLAGGAIDDAKLAIKYILNNDNISVVIPGMESVEQVLENSKVIAGDFSCDEENKINLIREQLNNNFCRRCGYCQPCPKGINIPLMFLCEGYYLRYNLKEWAKSRYDSMKVLPSNCIKCGKCESRCPYNIKIRDRIESIVKLMEGNNE